MLVLSRKANEDIVIPELNITIRVLDTKSNRVRIGISAPKEIRVERAEAQKPTVDRKLNQTVRKSTRNDVIPSGHM